jgi:hypothetical protein
VSGFQHAPGTPERRVADRDFLLDHANGTPVKNPSRYNVDNDRAFGLVEFTGGMWIVKHRGGIVSEDVYPSLTNLLDDGWTVD